MSGQDRIPKPCGFALKLFDVSSSGEMYPTGAHLPTQDLEFNSTPVIELADARTTKEIFQLRLAYYHDQDKLNAKYEEREDADLQKARDQVPNTPLQGITWWSQTASRFGGLVGKMRIASV